MADVEISNADHVVYVITNGLNGKRYVGRTRHPKTRWAKHRNDAKAGRGVYLHAAMRKHGVENFTFAVIQDNLTLNRAKSCEIQFIADWNLTTSKFGYNRTPGGEDVEWASRIALQKAKERFQVDPVKERARRSAAMVKANAAMTPQQRSEKLKRAFRSVDVERRSEQCRETWRKKSPEDRARIASSRQAKWTPDVMQAANEKRKASRTKEQRSESGKAASAQMSPEARIKRSQRAWESRIRNGNGDLSEFRTKTKEVVDAMYPERKAQWRKAIVDSQTPEQHRERVRKANSSRTKEQKLAIAQKSWETRRRRQKENNLVNCEQSDFFIERPSTCC